LAAKATFEIDASRCSSRRIPLSVLSNSSSIELDSLDFERTFVVDIERFMKLKVDKYDVLLLMMREIANVCNQIICKQI